MPEDIYIENITPEDKLKRIEDIINRAKAILEDERKTVEAIKVQAKPETKGMRIPTWLILATIGLILYVRRKRIKQ